MLKKYIRFIILFLLSGVFYMGLSNTAFASGDNSTVVIQDEDTDAHRAYDLNNYSELTFLDDTYEIEFLENSRFSVKQEVYVYFPSSRHGIFISIPFKYDNGFFDLTRIGINFNKVCYKRYSSTKKICNKYDISTEGRDKVLKIGDEDQLIKGVYKYEIEYTVTNALRSKGDWDELYWNVIGTGRQNETVYSNVKIYTSSDIDSILDPQEVVCYTGESGSQESDCFYEFRKSGSYGGQYVFIQIEEPLGKREGWSVAVKYPKDSFNEVLGRTPRLTKLWLEVFPFLGFLVPIPIFFLMLIAWFVWGKDYKPRAVIPLYRAPEDLSPIMASYLNNMRISTKSISASIINLAIGGYLKIKRKSKKKYEFINTVAGKDLESLRDYEREILKGLFGSNYSKESVTNKDLKEEFYKNIKTIYQDVKNSAKEKNYFYGKPETRVGCWSGIGIVIGILSVAIGLALFSHISYVIGGVLSAGIVLFFAFYMGKRTKKGTEKYKEVLGLEQYIDLAEEERIKFHDDPDKLEKNKVEIFESLLPYAMVLGLEKKWAKQFEDIYAQPPEWYSDYRSGRFNAIYLGNMLGSFNNTMNSTTFRSPSSEGSHVSSGGSGFSGGSSGGGFGGGSSGGW